MAFIDSLWFIPQTQIFVNKPLDSLTTYKTGGKVDYLIKITSYHQARLIESCAKDEKLKVKIIGNGSNILASDYGFNGVLISLEDLNSMSVKGKVVRVSAGAKLNDLIRFCSENNLSGLENLVGIPATVGGAICMNASSFCQQISNCVLSVCALKDGKLVKYYREDCNFSYRKSRFQTGKEVILYVDFLLDNDNKNEIIKRAKIFQNKRAILQPKGRTCGSIFRNGKDYFAGEVIDKCGLKGCSYGNAYVSEKHANFILAKEGAKSQDIFLLIQYIKQKVKEKSNISLIEEVKYLGKFYDFNGRLSHTHNL